MTIKYISICNNGCKLFLLAVCKIKCKDFIKINIRNTKRTLVNPSPAKFPFYTKKNNGKFVYKKKEHPQNKLRSVFNSDVVADTN